jgi:hypothetical protein
VGASLLHDFVRGGVHLPREQRDRVGELSAKVPHTQRWYHTHSDANEFALRIGTGRGLGWERRSRGRFATPADFAFQDCSACRGLHARRASVGVVPRRLRGRNAIRCVGVVPRRLRGRNAIRFTLTVRDGGGGVKVTRAEMTFSANLVDPSLSESFTVSRDVLAQMPSQV